jgi:hypothetical protein
MSKSAVTARIHEPLDVRRDIPAEVSFDRIVPIQDGPDLDDVVFREVLASHAGGHPGLGEDMPR